MTTLFKFVSHLFKKDGPAVLIADLPTLGQFICEKPHISDSHDTYNNHRRIKYDFLPSSHMQHEIMMQKRSSNINIDGANVIRRELSIDKIAEVCQLSIEGTYKIIVDLIKQIVSFNFIYFTA